MTQECEAKGATGSDWLKSPGRGATPKDARVCYEKPEQMRMVTDVAIVGLLSFGSVPNFKKTELFSVFISFAGFV